MVASQNIQDYYASGNKELATETLLTLQRLEAVRLKSFANDQ